MFTSRVTRLAPFAIIAAGLLAGGCVRQGDYDNLYENNRALTAKNQELLEQLRSLQATIADLQARLAAGDSAIGGVSASQAALRAEIERLRAKLAETERSLQGIQFTTLDSATDAALQQLAGQYPDLIEYDSTRGLIRFKSDITFASGSFELSSQGQTAVSALGRILGQLPSAQQYDVVIVGHTDAQRVSSRPGRRFNDNDELSAFRSISVTKALSSSGVDKRRCLFAGFGESRPAVANAGNGNTPQNRRVEVFLTRSLPTGAAAEGNAPAPARSAPARTPAANPDLMK